MRTIDYPSLLHEATVHFARSSGKGGQNVNKVETKVELTFNIPASHVLDEATKALLLEKLKSRLDTEGNLHISASSERHQHANRKKAEQKLMKVIQDALKPQKKRIATKPSGAAKIARLHAKKMHSFKKKLRSKQFND